MSWDNVDNKHKKKYDANFVSCEEYYERKYLEDLIKEEFPHFTREKIQLAIAHCCKSIPAPRGRNRFMDCIKLYLS